MKITINQHKALTIVYTKSPMNPDAALNEFPSTILSLEPEMEVWFSGTLDSQLQRTGGNSHPKSLPMRLRT